MFSYGCKQSKKGGFLEILPKNLLCSCQVNQNGLFEQEVKFHIFPTGLSRRPCEKGSINPNGDSIPGRIAQDKPRLKAVVSLIRHSVMFIRLSNTGNLVG